MLVYVYVNSTSCQLSAEGIDFFILADPNTMIALYEDQNATRSMHAASLQCTRASA